MTFPDKPIRRYLPEPEHWPQLARLCVRVGKATGFSPALFLTLSRSRNRVYCRNLVLALATRLTSLSTTEIAEGMGYADHASVFHAVRAVKHDPLFHQLLAQSRRDIVH